jgi:hypothetical protein
MRPYTITSDRETPRARDSPRSEGEPPCPVCEGPLIPLRGVFRCSRCYFSLCLGCEAGETLNPGAP